MTVSELRRNRAALATGAHPVGVGAARIEGRRSDGRTPWWTLIAIAALSAAGLAMVVGTVVVSGDGVWHLIWGRALMEGTLESFATGPTPHPSLLALGAVTSTLGDEISYAVTYLLFGPVAFGVLIASTFEVARRLSSRWAGAAAILILLTSVGLVSIGSAARYDIAFAALVMTAVALEMARPRRGFAPLLCLAVAGLIRPEAWVMSGAYGLWLGWGSSFRPRVRNAGLVVAAPAVWALMDLLVMGDPLYSLHVTDEASDALYRQYTPWENLVAAGRNLLWYLGVFPLLVAPAAVVLLARDRPRAALPLLGALGVTLGVFLLLLSQGMASSERYLLVPTCALAILAAMAVDGGGRRTPRRVIGGVFLAVILCLQVAARADVYGTVARDSADAHRHYESADALMRMPGVADAVRRCRVVSLPTGKMRHWFAFYSDRAPEAFTSDSRGRWRADLFIAPGSREVAEMALTRPRFDDDATFRVPPGVRPARRNADWILYASPTSACTAGLR